MINYRQDLLGRETEIIQALRETEEGLGQLDEVTIGNLEAPLETAHRLLQHLENQQPRVIALQAEIGQLQMTCTADESRILAQKSKELDHTTKVNFKTYITRFLSPCYLYYYLK